MLDLETTDGKGSGRVEWTQAFISELKALTDDPGSSTLVIISGATA